jgi:RNA polymerase sigma-70 factor (ECF subfamily)
MYVAGLKIFEVTYVGINRIREGRSQKKMNHERRSPHPSVKSMQTTKKPETTEGELIGRAQNGDMDAFSSLMEGVQARLLAQAIVFCGDPDLARDLVQETMIAAWKNLKRFDGSCQLFTWLYVILQRQHGRARGWFSRRLPSPTPEQILAGSRREATAVSKNSNFGDDESELLRAIVSALPPKHREVIRLRFYADASEAETARALGISTGTVKSRLHHALKKLQGMKEKLNLLRAEDH